MAEMIPRRLIFIWLGNEMPEYGKFCIESFKKANPSFDIMLVNDDPENPKNEDLIEVLKKIDLDEPSFYKHMVIRRFAKKNYVSNTGKRTGISDALRFWLLNKYGGIYLDLDTFPVKPFDDTLLSHENGFAVNFYKDHYDHFFMGFKPGCIDKKLVDSKFKSKLSPKVYKILYLDVLRIAFKDRLDEYTLKFLNRQLEIGQHMFPADYVSDYYIDHFRTNEWKKNT